MATATLQLNQSEFRNPFGIAVKTDEFDNNKTFHFYRVDLFDEKIKQVQLNHMVIFSYLLAWTIFSLVTLLK